MQRPDRVPLRLHDRGKADPVSAARRDRRRTYPTATDRVQDRLNDTHAGKTIETVNRP